MNAELRDEILALKQRDGRIYAPQVVDWARDNPASELHRHFVWDDRVAAERYRVDQARYLIQIHVVDDDAQRMTISLIYDRTRGGGYRDRDTVMNHREMRRAAMMDALTDLQRWQERNAHFEELAPIFQTIERVGERLRRPTRPRRVSRRGAGDQPGAAAAAS